MPKSKREPVKIRWATSDEPMTPEQSRAAERLLAKLVARAVADDAVDVGLVMPRN
jgi:hypothetical protein